MFHKNRKWLSVRMALVLVLISGAFGVLPVQATPSVVLSWAKSMGGISYDDGYELVLDASRNVYITGDFSGTVDFDPGVGTYELTSAGDYNIFISKLDTNGNFIWAKGMGGTGSYAIALDGSGNVYTTGIFYGTADFDPGVGTYNLTSIGLGDVFISKLDVNGNFVWAKRIGGGAFDDLGNDIALDGNGNVYSTGQFYGTVDFDPGAGTYNLTSAGGDIFISKLDTDGNFVWAKGMGDYGSAIAVDSGGNVHTTGIFSGTADFDPGIGTYNLTSTGGNDIFVSKLDTNGNFVWAKSMDGAFNEQGDGIALDGTGSVYSTGLFQDVVDFNPGAGVYNLTSAGSYDIFVSKLDTNGNFVWAKSMGGGGIDRGISIISDGGGNVYSTGRFQNMVDFDPGAGAFNLTSAGLADIFISKLDMDGNFVWAKSMGGTLNESGDQVVLDGSGNVYIAGTFFGTADFDPDAGTANLVSAGLSDIFVSKLDLDTAPKNISGNAGVGGVTLAYTDNGPKSVLADGSGNYTITVPSGWTGTVTPKKIGYQFTPVNKSYSNISTNQTAQDYTAAVCPTCADKDTVGVFRPSNGALYLRNLNVTGFADVAINYGLGGDYPVVGDWDGNGTDTIGIYRNGVFYLRNSNSLGFANITAAFGSPGDQPIAGDWNNDGFDTIGVYRSSTGTFLLRNSNTPGPADVTFALGNPGDVGIAGDWDGDGTDTTGVFRPSNGVIFLKNTNTSGFANIALNYGLPGDQPVVGDWDNNGTTTIGIYRNARFYLRNSNTNGFANIQLDLGNVGDMPIAGNWDAKP